MTTLPPHRPLLPVLFRMGGGLLLAAFSFWLLTHSVEVHRMPSGQPLTRALYIPLDGERQNDLAKSLTLKLAGDTTALRLGALPTESAALLQGELIYDLRQKLSYQENSTPRSKGRDVLVNAALFVKRQDALMSGRYWAAAPEISLRVSDAVPLSLQAETQQGSQNFDLSELRLSNAIIRSKSGAITLVLPQWPSGPLTIVNFKGPVLVRASTLVELANLRVSTTTGRISAQLAPLQLESLNLDTTTGELNLDLPRRVRQATLATRDGDLKVLVPSRAQGKISIRTEAGRVTLSVPADLHLHLGFSDGEELTLPNGARGAPQLEVVVNAPRALFSLVTRPESGALP